MLGSFKFWQQLTQKSRNQAALDSIVQSLNIPGRLPEKAAVDSHKHDWDWKNRRYWKKDFVQKHLSPIYFEGIS